MREIVANCSVFVLPSYSEGMSRSILEAMSMEKPIVTKDVPGCRETVINGENGFLVPVKDVQSLVTALEYFITFPDKVSQMGIAGMKIAIEKYDVSKVNKVILSAMEL